MARAFQLRLTSTVQDELQLEGATYGLVPQFMKWVESLVEAVSTGTRPSQEVDFIRFLETIDQTLTTPDNVGLRKRFASLGLIDKIKATVKGDNNQKHYEVRLATEVFLLESLLIEAMTVYKVDRASSIVTFLNFSVFPTVESPVDASGSFAAAQSALPVATVGVGTIEWDALTERRAALIYKKNRKGLNLEEEAEFARLQHLSRKAIGAFAPPPSMLDEKLTALDSPVSASQFLRTNELRLRSNEDSVTHLPDCRSENGDRTCL